MCGSGEEEALLTGQLGKAQWRRQQYLGWQRTSMGWVEVSEEGVASWRNSIKVWKWKSRRRWVAPAMSCEWLGRLPSTMCESATKLKTMRVGGTEGRVGCKKSRIPCWSFIKVLGGCSHPALYLKIIVIISKETSSLLFMSSKSVGWGRNAAQGIWSFAFWSYNRRSFKLLFDVWELRI